MCPMAKNPIWARKFPHEPMWSPIALKMNAIAICQGHIHSAETPSMATGIVTLCGISTGRKNNAEARRYAAVTVNAMLRTLDSFTFMIDIFLSFDANISIICEIAFFSLVNCCYLCMIGL